MSKDLADVGQETTGALRATLFLRFLAVIAVVALLPARGSIPFWMIRSFRAISVPLLAYNALFFVFFKRAAALLQKRRYLLAFDLIVSLGIVSIGGGWRSSYFGYTLTTVILFTIFVGRKGAYLSAAILALAALIKNPSGGFFPAEIFDASNLDMRLGACIFYIAAGLILGYFSVLLDRIRRLSAERIEETAGRAKAEEKMRLAFELHDGLKSKIMAILLILKPLVRESGKWGREAEAELQKVWRWLLYFQNEMSDLVDSLKERSFIDRDLLDVVKLAKEEARIVESMTGFYWQISSDLPVILVPAVAKRHLEMFFSEAMMNAWKHSGEASGEILLGAEGGLVRIVVRDKGKGFHSYGIEDQAVSGLKSLKQRACDLGGQLSIESRPGEGCLLTLSFPSSSVSQK